MVFEFGALHHQMVSCICPCYKTPFSGDLCCPAHVQLHLTATASAGGVLVLVWRAQARSVAFPAVDAVYCLTALIKGSTAAARILFSILATVNATSPHHVQHLDGHFLLPHEQDHKVT